MQYWVDMSCRRREGARRAHEQLTIRPPAVPQPQTPGRTARLAPTPACLFLTSPLDSSERAQSASGLGRPNLDRRERMLVTRLSRLRRRRSLVLAKKSESRLTAAVDRATHTHTHTHHTHASQWSPPMLTPTITTSYPPAPSHANAMPRFAHFSHFPTGGTFVTTIRSRGMARCTTCSEPPVGPPGYAQLFFDIILHY
ncbi:uncharacterized protein BKA78DRAFT_192285 [Phyllosticta capitalensis]|uniref:uncharacterized protein n=1 Tax=Phyllosticta capitalensis TaxID=121624 RepID=UPI0031320A34